jgi:putative ubiquitin-RnfH superfamily antitoxin RatB of RatAB toxin-antitoxin module
MFSLTLVYSPAPRQLLQQQFELAEGATVATLLPELNRLLGLDVAQLLAEQTLEIGVWGQRCTLAQRLQPGDRLECYRVLRVDPKVARRERFSRQGVGSAGLFAQRRQGAKPGY